MDFHYNDDYYEKKYQMQTRINKQKQQQYLDCKDVTDTLMPLLAIAEAIALQNSSKKELGYYDEYDTTNRKSNNSQIIQLLRLTRQFGGIKKKNFNALYTKDKYQLPKEITPKYIIKKISFWKSLLKSENIVKYFDEILNVLNGKPTLDINKE